MLQLILFDNSSTSPATQLYIVIEITRIQITVGLHERDAPAAEIPITFLRLFLTRLVILVPYLLALPFCHCLTNQLQFGTLSSISL